MVRGLITATSFVRLLHKDLSLIVAMPDAVLEIFALNFAQLARKEDGDCAHLDRSAGNVLEFAAQTDSLLETTLALALEAFVDCIVAILRPHVRQQDRITFAAGASETTSTFCSTEFAGQFAGLSSKFKQG